MRKSWAVAAAVVVLISEVLAIGSFGIWAHSVTDKSWVSFALLGAGLVAWTLFAFPWSRFGGPIVSPSARLLLYGLALLAVFAAGHPALGLVETGIFVVALALARQPEVLAVILRADRMGRSDRADRSTDPSRA